MTTTIDTTKVSGRRNLHFHTLDDILADVDRLAKAREILTLGNWSAGQIFQHLAVVMNHSIDGFQVKLFAPLRWFLHLVMKNKVLNGPMTPGFRLSKAAAAELIPPPTALEEGLHSIRAALHRLQTESKRVPSAFLGHLTHEEWTKLHCRHSELHLSFLVPVE